jgi:ribosomal protein L27
MNCRQLVQILLLAAASDAWGWVGQSLPAPRGRLGRHGLHPVSKSQARRLQGGAICLRASGGKAWSRPGGSAGGDKGIEQIFEGKVKFFNQEKGSRVPTLLQPSLLLGQQHDSPPSREATPASRQTRSIPLNFLIAQVRFHRGSRRRGFCSRQGPGPQRAQGDRPFSTNQSIAGEKAEREDEGQMKRGRARARRKRNSMMPVAGKQQGKLTYLCPGDFDGIMDPHRRA